MENEYIDTVGQLIELLQQYPLDMKLNIRYDSGYGQGGIIKSGVYIENGELRIDVTD